jgi:hypothetical protein
MATVRIERTWAGTGVWWQWVLASMVGWAAGWALFGTFADGLARFNPLGLQIGHLFGWMVGGAVIGMLQWLVLRRQIDLAAWSILASSIGLTAGFIAGYALGGPPFDFLLAFTLVGLVNGIVQWLALRQQVERAGWWIVASCVGFALGGAVAVGVALAVGDAVDAGLGGGIPAFAAILTIIGFVGGAVGGAISGSVLARLLPHPGPAA